MKTFTVISLLFASSTASENLLENYDRELSTIKLLFYPNTHAIDEPIVIANENSNYWVKDERKIDYERDVKLLIHGWNAAPDHTSMQPVLNAYLRLNVSHVVSVDWREIAEMPYIVARDLIGPIGKRICEIFRGFIDAMKVNPGRVHIIGHSLGAHIGTHVGRCFNSEIGRMTSLDPAGVLFTPFSTDAVSKHDFVFLDQIHTSAGLAGEFEIRGHCDIYPNKGTAPQPGCEKLDIFTFTACSHYRAPLYFAESILLPDAFKAHQCDLSLIQLPAHHRNCLNGSGVVLMGEHIDRSARGVFYVETFSNFPYGKGTML